MLLGLRMLRCKTALLLLPGLIVAELRKTLNRITYFVICDNFFFFFARIVFIAECWVKWKNLPADDATWEDLQLLKQQFPARLHLLVKVLISQEDQDSQEKSQVFSLAIVVLVLGVSRLLVESEGVK